MRYLAAIGFTLNRAAADPLFMQLCDQLRQRIVAGSVAPHSSLPPSRGLAAELGISRSTAINAYDQLQAEGYIEGIQGSGYRIRELGASDRTGAATPRATNTNPPARSSRTPAPSHPGYPDNRLFPYAQWAQPWRAPRACRRARRSSAKARSGTACCAPRSPLTSPTGADSRSTPGRS